VSWSRRSCTWLRELSVRADGHGVGFSFPYWSEQWSKADWASFAAVKGSRGRAKQQHHGTQGTPASCFLSDSSRACVVMARQAPIDTQYIQWWRQKREEELKGFFVLVGKSCMVKWPLQMPTFALLAPTSLHPSISQSLARHATPLHFAPPLLSLSRLFLPLFLSLSGSDPRTGSSDSRSKSCG